MLKTALEYKNETERQELIDNNIDKFLLKDHIDLKGKKTLIFSDEPRPLSIADRVKQLEDLVAQLRTEVDELKK